DDDELRAEFGDMVPVVLVNGVTHGYFHVDPIRLRKALV
ncbi:MAG: glutaredoxin family protein, partial [Actinomycetota bacterium]|nr:glutaredoxin family protein [Actinomycetota bacterium]